MKFCLIVKNQCSPNDYIEFIQPEMRVCHSSSSKCIYIKRRGKVFVEFLNTKQYHSLISCFLESKKPKIPDFFPDSLNEFCFTVL